LASWARPRNQPEVHCYRPSRSAAGAAGFFAFTQWRDCQRDLGLAMQSLTTERLLAAD